MPKKFKAKIKKKSIHILQKLAEKVEKNPSNRLLNDYQYIFRKNGINICYNRFIPRDYYPDKKNILIAIDSPAVIDYNKWLKPEMEFVAEISFANYYNLKYYYCPRTLYAANDSYVFLKPSREYNKNRLVSMIYSRNKRLAGHKYRHEIADRFKAQIDRYGTGVDDSIQTTDIKKITTLDKYMFQIAVENGKHPEYVSEKFFDCIKTKAIPIYWGGEEAIKKMGFNVEGVLFFDTLEDLEKLFDEKISRSTYEEKKEAIDYNLNRLIEIRNEIKFNFFLNILRTRYLNTMYSYHEKNFSAFSLDFD